MICNYIKSNSSQCEANAMTNSTLCFTHNPEMETERQIAVRKGGSSPKKNYDSLPVLTITDSKSVVSLLITTINEVRAGEVDIRVANCIGYLSGALIKAFEISDLEQRVQKIEKISKTDVLETLERLRQPL